jgi:hypothetical protein
MNYGLINIHSWVKTSVSIRSAVSTVYTFAEELHKTFHRNRVSWNYGIYFPKLKIRVDGSQASLYTIGVRGVDVDQR